jgi:hypothetical protein
MTVKKKNMQSGNTLFQHFGFILYRFFECLKFEKALYIPSHLVNNLKFMVWSKTMNDYKSMGQIFSSKHSTHVSIVTQAKEFTEYLCCIGKKLIDFALLGLGM